MAPQDDATTLAELLVALGLLALATVVGLMLHARIRATFVAAEGRAARQQAVRIGLDTLLRDLGRAGSGGKGEPCEGAWPTAIVLTGGEGFVGYALARPDGSGAETLAWESGGQTLEVDDLSLTQGLPPYTLYRLSAGRDGTTVRRAPVIDGVARLSFAYFDSAGEPLEAPGGADADAGRRARIRRVRVHVDSVGARSGERGFGLATELAPRNLGLRRAGD